MYSDADLLVAAFLAAVGDTKCRVVAACDRLVQAHREVASDAVAPRTIEEAQLNQPVGSRVPQDPTADLCKAGELQWLVGKPKSEIPVPVQVVNRRVACTTCAIASP